jgi:hypothetical protein
MRLDERWGVGYWDSDRAPAAPVGLCEACGRRSAIFVIGGVDEEFPEDDEEPTYLGDHPIHICGWCRIDSDMEVRNGADRQKALAEAGARSVGWRWR